MYCTEIIFLYRRNFNIFTVKIFIYLFDMKHFLLMQFKHKTFFRAISTFMKMYTVKLFFNLFIGANKISFEKIMASMFCDERLFLVGHEYFIMIQRLFCIRGFRCLGGKVFHKIQPYLRLC